MEAGLEFIQYFPFFQNCGTLKLLVIPGKSLDQFFQQFVFFIIKLYLFVMEKTKNSNGPGLRNKNLYSPYLPRFIFRKNNV